VPYLADDSVRCVSPQAYSAYSTPGMVRFGAYAVSHRQHNARCCTSLKNQTPDRCPHWANASSRKGRARKKLEDVPLYRCRSCGRTFSPGLRDSQSVPCSGGLTVVLVQLSSARLSESGAPRGGGHEQQTVRAPLSLRHGWIGPFPSSAVRCELAHTTSKKAGI
jgi:hypothetical protein